jgi:hypothetical protein
MPVYLYRLKNSGERLEASHPMSAEPQTWAELCEVAGLDPAAHPADAPVERLIVPVRTQVGQFTSEIKNTGFRRLERRDSGVYEDVTAPKGERIVDAND